MNPSEIYNATLVLEAFGNAATLTNRNSSRYSSFLELQYDAVDAVVGGCKFSVYGLEAHRAAIVPKSERNFHVFHYLISGSTPAEKQSWKLGNGGKEGAKFEFLTGNSVQDTKEVLGHIDGIKKDNDAENMSQLRTLLRTLGITKKTQSLLFQTLAAILHMGQIHFQRDSEHTSDQCFVKHREPLEIAAQLMGVEADALEGALTNKSQLVGDVMCTDFLDPQSATESRNNLASTVYSMIFTWLVEQINTRLAYKDPMNLGSEPSYIGLLDLAGFENNSSAPASFHQMQANYIAEKIQALVREDLMDQVVVAYAKQGLSLAYEQGQDCLDLFERRPTGIISLFDQECSTAQGKEANVLEVLKKQQLNAPIDFFSFGAQEGSFVVRHHHTAVTYQTTGWVALNRTAISPDFVKLFRSNNAKNPFLASLFQDSRIETQRHPRNGKSLVGARRSLSNMARKPATREQGCKTAMWEVAPPKTPVSGTPTGRRGSMVPPPKSASTTSVVPPNLLSPSTNQQKMTPLTARKLLPPVDIGSPLSPVSPGWFVSSSVMGHLRSALDEVVSSIREARCWHIFCINPSEVELGKSVELNETLVKQQLQSMDLARISKICVQELPIRCSFSYFLNRFKTLLYPQGNYHLELADEIAGSNDFLKQMCQQVCQTRGWTSQVYVGNDKIFLDETIYKSWESELDMSVPDASFRRLHKISEETKEASDVLKLWETCDACMAGILITRSNKTLIVVEDVKKERGVTGEEITKTAQLDSFVSMDQEAMDAAQDPEAGKKAKFAPPAQPPQVLSKQRIFWLKVTKVMTWWIPEKWLISGGKMTRPEVRQAWREKVALCELIAILSGFLLFFVVGLPALLCPTSNVHTKDEVKQHHSFDSKDMWMAWNGMIYDMSYFYHPTGANDDLSLNQLYFPFAGMDVSPYFPTFDPETGALPPECAAPGQEVAPLEPLDPENYPQYDPGVNAKCYVYKNIDGHCHQTHDIARKIKYQQLPIVPVGAIAYDPSEVATHNTPTDAWITINGKIYDITRIISGQGIEVGPNTLDIITNYKGRDASVWAKQLAFLQPCLDAAFFRGVIDNRNEVRCQVSSYILFGVTGLLVGVMIIRFLSALQLGSKRIPEDLDRYTIMMVPCYTEGEESLKKTINSLALLSYVDERKLLFVIADGMIRGSGNEKSTPELVLEILGIDMQSVDADHPPLDYVAVAEGSKQHNRAKVYSGWYSIQARLIPFIVVVKCGTENETTKPGNRGKRDSQMVLMRFLSKVQTRQPMTPMELEVYRQIQVTFGVDPFAYEFVLMVDADTEVMGDSLNRLISCMVHDTRIMGISGETSISNEKSTIVTMIQVYEYYISHYLAKAFESLFGNVTCLPGCFCMYRIRTVGKIKPLLVAPEVIEAYAATNVDTLHKKNLFSLGEDRYLTTLMLKTFPEMRTKFTGDAHCKTVVPDKWEVLLSQRRRWINSTVHNMYVLYGIRLIANRWELLFINQLCGCLCFSMRFVVFLDLFATLTMPAAVCYLFFLIYASIQSMTVPTISLIMISIAYGLQIIIFILKRKFEHIGWMIISILATPFFSLMLPMYSYWHFDDFSWVCFSDQALTGKGKHSQSCRI